MVGIGIDLGTTNCCVGVVKNGRVEILENVEGLRTTPSVIGFRNNEIVIGEVAKKDLCRFPESTVYDVKRLIGLKQFGVRDILSHLQFPVALHEKKLKIGVIKNKKLKYYLPEELSGFLLDHLKKGAEARLDSVIDNVVITVPSYFNDSQRQATIDAAKIAGFKNVNLLNEPTAAALHYGLDNKIDGRTILIFDFGGGTFDISIIKYKNNVYEVMMIDGDAKLGGVDIDNKLVEYIKKEYNIEDLKDEKKNRRQMARLKAASENAKIDLSTKIEVDIELTVDDDQNFKITRQTFNEISEDIINKAMDILKKCIQNLNIKIDDIVLVGGSTRIPKIKEELTKIFKIDIKENTNPDEAVAAGAAIYAAKLYDNQFPELKTINICQHSLGVETDGEKMSVLIEKFTKLPAQKTKKYKTANADDTTIDVKIFCGDDPSTKNNIFLGEFRVNGIKSGPGGTILKETFEVDENGIIHVSAVDEGGQSKQMTFDLNNGNLTSKEIDYYNEQLSKDIILSEKIKQFKELKNELESKQTDSSTGELIRELEYSEENYLLVVEKLKKK